MAEYDFYALITPDKIDAMRHEVHQERIREAMGEAAQKPLAVISTGLGKKGDKILVRKYWSKPQLADAGIRFARYGKEATRWKGRDASLTKRVF